MITISASLSEMPSFDDEEAREDEDDEETKPDQRCADGELGWVMGTSTRTVEHGMERIQLKRITIDKLTQPKWEDAPDDVRETGKRYSKCDGLFWVTRLWSWFGNSSDGPVQLVIGKTGVPARFGDRFKPHRGSNLPCLQLLLEISICVMIVS
jgi:hypothetical protein